MEPASDPRRVTAAAAWVPKITRDMLLRTWPIMVTLRVRRQALLHRLSPTLTLHLGRRVHMELSPRARAFLARARQQPCPRDRAHVSALIAGEGLPAFDAVVSFQERYGGADYRTGTSGFLLGITWDGGINGFQRDDGRYVFECARHPQAPWRFFLDQQNAFYVDVYPLAERFETWLESEALLDEMDRKRDWYCKPIGQVPRDDQRLDAVVGLPPLLEASDAYLKWWGTDEVRVVRAGFWDPDTRIDDAFVYARTRGETWAVSARLKGLTGRYA